MNSYVDDGYRGSDRRRRGHDHRPWQLAEIHARLCHLRATDRDRGCMHSRVAGFDVRRLLILVLFLTVVGLLS